MLRLTSIFVLLGLSTIGFSPSVFADPLVGDVAAAYTTAENTLINPANGCFLDRTQGSGGFDVYNNESFLIRYPGSQPITDTKSGVGSLVSGVPPSVVFKITPRFALGAYAIPPGISVDVTVNRLPIVVLNQTNFVDVNAKGRADAIAGFTMSYRLSEKLGIGIGGNIRSISFDATLTPSEGGVTLAELIGKTSDLNALLGIRFDPIPGRLGFGLGVTGFTIHNESSDVQGPLIASANNGTNTATSNNLTVPLSHVDFGFMIGNPRMKFLGDLRYTRIFQGQEAFSIVDLKTKSRDLHDTVGVSIGTIFALSEKINATAGFKYEPSSIGPGSKEKGGDPGTSGFGTMDVAQVFSGLAPMTPYTQIAAGIQVSLWPRIVAVREAKSKSQGVQKFYAMTLSSGIAYREATLGIDKDGEQPGAYFQKKYFIPTSLTIKL